MPHTEEQSLDKTIEERIGPQRGISPGRQELEEERRALEGKLQILNQFGDNPTRLAGIAGGLGLPELERDIVSGGRANEFGSRGGGQSPESIRSARDQLLREVEGRLAGLGSKLTDVRLEDLKTREGELGKELLASEDRIQIAIDERLTGLLEQTGFAANLARSQVGGAFAQKGLSRSTFAARGVGNVTLREQGQRTSQRSRAEQQSTRATQTVDATFREIRRTRTQAELTRSLASIQTAEDIVFAIDQTAFENQLKLELFEQGFNDSTIAAFLPELGAGLGGAFGSISGGPSGGKQGKQSGGTAGSGAADVAS